MTTSQIVKWASGFAVGVGAIIWLYGTFLTKAEHDKYVTSHKEWSMEVLSTIHKDIGELKVDNKELKNGHSLILRKLDNIETRMMINPQGKQSAKVGSISTNIYE